MIRRNLVLTFILYFGCMSCGVALKKSAASVKTHEASIHVAGMSQSENSLEQLKKHFSQRITEIDPEALETGLKAYMCATHTQRQGKRRYLTIIDYNKPSSQKRMYIIDMVHQKLISSQLVAHGQNTGGREALNFSNRDGSHQSSLGVFVTQTPYRGKHGLSLRLQGLERGYNDNAHQRAIVLHGANYVNQDYVRKYGMIGRSWGCPAIDNTQVKTTVNTLKSGSIIVAYFKDNQWLSKSNYLHCKVSA